MQDELAHLPGMTGNARGHGGRQMSVTAAFECLMWAAEVVVGRAESEA